MVNFDKIQQQKELIIHTLLPEDKKEKAIEVLDFILSLKQKQVDYLFLDKTSKDTMDSFSIEEGNSEEVIYKLKQILKENKI